MESIFLYLLNRKPIPEEKIRYQNLPIANINKLIINSDEYSKFLDSQKKEIFALICNRLAISHNLITEKSGDIIFQKILAIKRNNNFTNQKIINLLDEIDIFLKEKIKFILGEYSGKIFKKYQYLGEVRYKYLENYLVFNVEKLDNLYQCYQHLIWDDKFINFVENSIDKSL